MNQSSQKRILVDEIFGPTLQGEGPMVGMPVVFVRTGGCDYRCSWCDTLHAVLPRNRKEWRAMTASNILDEVKQLSNDPLWVVVSGGNPALQPLEELLRSGQQQGYRFALETQGSIVPDWFGQIDHLTLSPKPPSAGMETDWSALKKAVEIAKTGCAHLKVPVLNQADLSFVADLRKRHPELPLTLQPVNAGAQSGALQDDDNALHEKLMEQMRWLHEQVVARHWYDVRVLPQLHVMIWGTGRGV
ncbi:7-carboxy-7-deazaguanine synthase QueE [Granulosicoccus sp. 3-233]|uniref:7-carboxy-7-deazaguanine synthase QueE n=1 Tax=Granulosicoccus sp. 3-233 TaxID=3417969 RepID=UPI003D33B9E2